MRGAWRACQQWWLPPLRRVEFCGSVGSGARYTRKSVATRVILWLSGHIEHCRSDWAERDVETWLPLRRARFVSGPEDGRVWATGLGRLTGYLVDPASSHMLVSKIKPCMSKYKRLYCETANGSLNQLWFI